MQQMNDGDRASVVMLRGHGEQRLRQAIAQGLVREDLESDFNEVLAAIASKSHELDILKGQLARSEKSNADYKRIYFDAIQALERGKRRKKQLSTISTYALYGGAAFVIIFICTMISSAIFR